MLTGLKNPRHLIAMQMARSTCLDEYLTVLIEGPHIFAPTGACWAHCSIWGHHSWGQRTLWSMWWGSLRFWGHWHACCLPWQRLPVPALSSCSQPLGDLVHVVDTEPLNFLPPLLSGLLACNQVFLFGGLRALWLPAGFLWPLPLPQGQGLRSRVGGTVGFIPYGAMKTALDWRPGCHSSLATNWSQDLAYSFTPGPSFLI